MQEILHEFQERFGERLRFERNCREGRQAAEARCRERMGLVSRERIEWRVWQDECHKKTCEDCRHEKHEGLCPVTFSVLFWVRCPRRLARIHAAHEERGRIRRGRTKEWRDWNAGAPGGKGCGPSSWDNAIRAAEEDR